MIDNDHNHKVNKIFTDSRGNNWYSLINPLQISASRGVAAAKAKRYVDMMISEGEYRRLLSEARSAAKTMDVIKVFAIVNELAIRAEFICEENSIFDLVCIYFFLQDEDCEYPSDLHNKRKLEILREDQKARTFFLAAGKSLIERFSNISEADFLTYLEENRAFAERIDHFFLNSSETSTTS